MVNDTENKANEKQMEIKIPIIQVMGNRSILKVKQCNTKGLPEILRFPAFQKNLLYGLVDKSVVLWPIPTI